MKRTTRRARLWKPEREISVTTFVAPSAAASPLKTPKLMLPFFSERYRSHLFGILVSRCIGHGYNYRNNEKENNFMVKIKIKVDARAIVKGWLTLNKILSTYFNFDLAHVP